MKKNKIQLTPYQIREKKYRRDDSYSLNIVIGLLGALWFIVAELFNRQEYSLLSKRIENIIESLTLFCLLVIFIFVFIDIRNKFKSKRHAFENVISEDNLKREKKIILISHNEILLEDRLHKLQFIKAGLNQIFKKEEYEVVFAPKLHMFQKYYIDESIGIYQMIEINDYYNIEKRKKAF